MPLDLDRIIETALYVDDMERADEFYGVILGLKPLRRSATLAAYDVNGNSVLLIFKRGGSAHTQEFTGSTHGSIPAHDGSGPLHICFAVAADQLAAWDQRLIEGGIAIEARMHWTRGGDSVYFRDPDNHLLELMTPGNWESY